MSCVRPEFTKVLWRPVTMLCPLSSFFCRHLEVYFSVQKIMCGIIFLLFLVDYVYIIIPCIYLNFFGEIYGLSGLHFLSVAAVAVFFWV